MDTYTSKCLTPEQLIKEMSITEVQELLEALAMTASDQTARRLQNLVRTTNCLEAAIETLTGNVAGRRAA